MLGDQNLVKHLAGDFFHFLHGLDDVDASLKTVFEGAFTTAASVYLCLNYVLGEAHVPGRLCCFLSCGGGNALGGSHAKTLKELFCLIFVNVHDSGPFGQMFAEERLGLFLMSVKGEWFGLLIFVRRCREALLEIKEDRRLDCVLKDWETSFPFFCRDFL